MFRLTNASPEIPLKGKHLLYGFLTTEPNDVVGPIHPKAMPVILTDAAECDTWLSAPWEEASKLPRPLPDGVLNIVASGEREHSGRESSDCRQEMVEQPTLL
jgi:putative SOS response-associated peptidase YedK